MIKEELMENLIGEDVYIQRGSEFRKVLVMGFKKIIKLNMGDPTKGKYLDNVYLFLIGEHWYDITQLFFKEEIKNKSYYINIETELLSKS